MEKQTIKAIETEYNGYRFRSRLEARWAVFFDAVGIEYEYEPDGFQLQDGTWYLADFYFPKFGMYIEIKNKNAFKLIFENDMVSYENSTEDASKYLMAAYSLTSQSDKLYCICLGDPYDIIVGENQKPHIFYNGSCKVHELLKEETIVEKIKEFSCIDQYGKEHDCKMCDGYKVGMCNITCPTLFSNEAICAILSDNNYPIPQNALDRGLIFMRWDFLSDLPSFQSMIEINLKAAFIARQARFEHGETPTAKQVYEMAHSGGVFNAD